MRLTIYEYEKVVEQTAMYPEAGTGSLRAVTYCALGLGEAGEVQGKVKKIYREDYSLNEIREDLLDEAGDVLWYLTRLATELGSSLEALMDRNSTKLLSRKARGTLQGSGDHR